MAATPAFLLFDGSPHLLKWRIVGDTGALMANAERRWFIAGIPGEWVGFMNAQSVKDNTLENKSKEGGK